MTPADFLTDDSHGYIHLTGHRIGLRHVVELYRENYSPEMICDHFPTLPLELIQEVIAIKCPNRIRPWCSRDAR